MRQTNRQHWQHGVMVLEAKHSCVVLEMYKCNGSCVGQFWLESSGPLDVNAHACSIRMDLLFIGRQ